MFPAGGGTEWYDGLGRLGRSLWLQAKKEESGRSFSQWSTGGCESQKTWTCENSLQDTGRSYCWIRNREMGRVKSVSGLADRRGYFIDTPWREPWLSICFCACYILGFLRCASVCSSTQLAVWTQGTIDSFELDGASKSYYLHADGY